MADVDERLLDATTGLLPPLLAALEALGRAGRLLHPPYVDALAEGLAPFGAPLADGLDAFQAVSWPENLLRFTDAVREAAGQTLGALDGFVGAGDSTNRPLPRTVPWGARRPLWRRCTRSHHAAAGESLLSQRAAARR